MENHRILVDMISSSNIQNIFGLGIIGEIKYIILLLSHAKRVLHSTLVSRIL